jgi:hypothetical protein
VGHFTQLEGLPILDLLGELDRLISNGVLNWDSRNQMCLNTIPGHEDDYMLGTGSLTHDWDNSRIEVDAAGVERTIVDKFATPRKEWHFTSLCNQFKDTLFEQAYLALSERYKLGRVRLMKSKSKTCLSWHVDDQVRIHYPLKTQVGCFMVIEDEMKHLTQNTWWLTNTLPFHTAFNASKEDRIHLVATVISDA